MGTLTRSWKKCIAITFDFFETNYNIETLLGHCRPFFHSLFLQSLSLALLFVLSLELKWVNTCVQHHTQSAAVLPCFMDEEKKSLIINQVVTCHRTLTILLCASLFSSSRNDLSRLTYLWFICSNSSRYAFVNNEFHYLINIYSNCWSHNFKTMHDFAKPFTLSSP